MDAEPHCQPLAPKPHKELRRWNYDEENKLLQLIESENMNYGEAASVLNRSIQSVQHRYSIIRQRDACAAITWTSEIDAAIIDGRRRMLSTNQIAQEINMPEKAIQSRWQALRATKKVPEDVLALRRHKQLRDFSPQEDEAILRLYVQRKDDKEIAALLGTKERTQTEIMTRRRKLVAENSPIYRRLVRMSNKTWEGDGNIEETDALGQALGKSRSKYEWMNE
jgi:hypothetical protein